MSDLEARSPWHSSSTGSATVLSEPNRLAAVRRLLRLRSPEGLERLTSLAALLLGAPRAQVSLIAELQVVAASTGITPEPVDPTPAEDSLCRVTLERGAPLAIEDAVTDERVNGLSPVRNGTVVSYLGVPLVDRDGLVLGALCVHDVQPRLWSSRDVGVLGELAASVVAELELLAVTEELASGAARLDLTLTAAGAGAFDVDLDTGRLTGDDRLLDLFGYAADEFDEQVDSVATRVHPDDLERVTAVLAGVVAEGGDLAVECRVVRPDGTQRRVVARGRILERTSTERGRLLGVAQDSTELLDSRDRLARVLSTMSDAFFSLDRSWRITWVNGEAERIFGRPADQLVGALLWSLDPGLEESDAGERYRLAMASGEATTFEGHGPTTGTTYEVRAWPQEDGLGVYLLDMTERRRAEQERQTAYDEREQAVVERERAYAAAEAATTRLALLADATTRLSASLEPEQVLQTLADIVVPALGAWMVVVMRTESGGLLREDALGEGPLSVVLARHGRAERTAELTEILAGMVLDPTDERGPGAVLRTGRPDWISSSEAQLLADLIPDPDRQQRLETLGLGPSLTVPMSSRGRRLATLTVVAPQVDAVDHALLADLAGRAAVALENALLYGDERRTGLTLQRSLLPREMPRMPDLEVAVRYLPGATGAAVGGDWYQGILVDGCLVIAIGDVMGHGMTSAARMGQLRAIVATLALEGHGPGALLDRLSAHADELLDLELATLLVARYDPAARTLVLASAGHPPLLHAPIDRAPYFVDCDPGPPIGTFPGTYAETLVQLGAADTVVLYTDGLVERRTEDLDRGLERLRQALAELKLPPEAVADHVLRTLGRTRGGDDDVALLVFAHAAATAAAELGSRP